MNHKLQNNALNRLSNEEFRQKEKNKIVVLLDNVRSLNNVGSVFRTCDAFLIEEILLCGVTGTPPNKEIEKTALGATSSVKWQYFKTTKEALNYLKENHFKIYSVEQADGSVMLNKFSVNDGAIALIFGNEVYGVDQEVIDLSDGVIEIPQAGTKHSLNISVSTGIVLWELLRSKILDTKA
jgi:23S rRNA (guanosine2251-2'-O)-methyltransferase